MNRESINIPALCGVLLLAACRLAGAQNPNLAPLDIAYSHDAYHLVAWVSLEFKGETESFQFDRYKEDDLQRVKKADGATYARKHGGKWLKSGDWGDTGTPVSDELAAELDTDANVVAATFAPPVHRDPSQGGTAWKFISQSQGKDVTYFVYEESREKPNPDVIYPRFTFEKWPKDEDGSLLLSKFTGRLRDDINIIPVVIQFDYMVPLPPGTTVKYFPAGKPPFTVTVPPATNR